jgi:hypothetical protein
MRHSAPCSLRLVLPVLAALSFASCDALEKDPDFSVRAYEGATITPESAAGWTATVADGVITLKGEGRDAGTLGLEDVVFIEATIESDLLPRLNDVWVGPSNGLGDVLESAVLEVQDWSVPGVVSGKLTGHDRRGDTYSHSGWKCSKV